MLRVEVGMYSGRPNPVWIVTDEARSNELLKEVSANPRMLAKPGSGFTGLGYREVKVRLLGDDEGRRIPAEFSVGSVAAEDFEASGALARRLIKEMPVKSNIRLQAHEITPLSRGLTEAILERLERYLHDRPPGSVLKPQGGRNPLRTTVVDERCKQCEYEVSQFNPAFWNRPAVQPHNNCYNYGRNWRTDTFAQPGRAHGAQATSMSCSKVTAAAIADGLRKRCDCLPPKEYPRRMVALVMDPDPFGDYHWYRHQRGGFWGHKPGEGAARNVDNSNVVIANPETCDRGRYNQFCGYFYAGRSVVID